MNNKVNIAELQAALQQERIKNAQLEKKAALAKEELENLLTFFNKDEAEMNKEIVKLKKVAAYWQKLAEELKANIEGEQNKNKDYKDLILKIGRIALECEKCSIEPPAMKFKCPECQDKKLKEIAGLF